LEHLIETHPRLLQLSCSRNSIHTQTSESSSAEATAQTQARYSISTI